MIRLLVVRGASISRKIMLLCSSAATLLLLSGLQAPASTLNTEVATSIGAIPQLEPPPIQPPELPPLGEPSIFMPTELPSPASPTQNVRLAIKLSERRVYVYRDEQVVTSYPIAVGKDGWETPTGTFQVMQKVHDPMWQHPWTGEIVEAGPDNPLGSRWIGFWTDGKDYIGFHGTPNEDSVGQAASHGCIRMLDRDVVSLFEQVDIGTPVTVEP